MHKPRVLCSIIGCLLLLILVGTACSRQNGRSAAGQSGTNAPMLIVPRMSVGKINAGMTVQQLVAEIGEPRNKTANAYDYPQLGLAVMPKEGLVLAVLCGDVTGINGSYVKVFNGRTKEGIGLRSTREELLKAYGPPAEMKGIPGGLESMKYENVGITFNLEGGKVYHMIILLDGQAPPRSEERDDSIKLNIGTPPADAADRR
jgi:hypothetical protein